MSADAKKPEHFQIDFIDPLFAAALHIGFTHGLLEEEWFKNNRFPISAEWPATLTYLLAFLTVMLSWVGYHASVREKPIKGGVRFILDVVLLVFYVILLVKFKSLAYELVLLGLIYTVFGVWDLFKKIEYPEALVSRQAVTWVFAVLFWLDFLLFTSGIIGIPGSLGAAYFLTLSYRILKYSPKLKLLSDVSKGVMHFVKGSGDEEQPPAGPN